MCSSLLCCYGRKQFVYHCHAHGGDVTLPQNPLIHGINSTHETLPLQGRFYLVKHYRFLLAHFDPTLEKSNLKRHTFSCNNQVIFNIISFLFVEKGWFAHTLWFFATPPLKKNCFIRFYWSYVVGQNETQVELNSNWNHHQKKLGHLVQRR